MDNFYFFSVGVIEINSSIPKGQFLRAGGGLIVCVRTCVHACVRACVCVRVLVYKTHIYMHPDSVFGTDISHVV